MDGTARQGQAYEARDGVLSFEANETTKQVMIPLIHDYEWNPVRDVLGCGWLGMVGLLGGLGWGWVQLMRGVWCWGWEWCLRRERQHCEV